MAALWQAVGGGAGSGDGAGISSVQQQAGVFREAGKGFYTVAPADGRERVAADQATLPIQNHRNVPPWPPILTNLLYSR